MTKQLTSRKNCLVTGGAGFIGSHLVERLLAAGHRVHVFDNFNTGRVSNLEVVAGDPKLSVTEGDVRDISALNDALHGVDWIFHLAGMADVVPSIENPDTYFQTNVVGTFNLLQAVRESKIEKFIYAASSSCYGIAQEVPTTEACPIAVEYPYALTKQMAEELVLHWGKVYGLPVISLRLFNVYGPRARTQGSYGSVLGVFLRQKLAEKPFTVVGDGTQSRDFVYVTDVAEAFHKAAASVATTAIINIGAGEPQSVNRLVELLGGTVVHVPKRPGEPDITHADITQAAEILDWRPTVTFEQGVGLVLARIEDWRDAPLWAPESIARATASWFAALK